MREFSFPISVNILCDLWPEVPLVKIWDVVQWPEGHLWPPPHASHHRTHKCTAYYIHLVWVCSQSCLHVRPSSTEIQWDCVCVCCCKQTYIILHCIPSTHRPTPMSPDLKNPRIPAHLIWRDPSRVRRLSTEQRWRSQREVCLDKCVWGTKSSVSVGVFSIGPLSPGLCLLMSTALS